MHVSYLVFSRTHNADYRLLAAPIGFGPDDVGAIEPFIDVALDAPDTLATTIRWCTFRVGGRLILGSSGFVTLFGVDPSYARDRFNRPIVAFVGVVFETNIVSTFPDEPPLPQMRAALAHELEREWRTPVISPFRNLAYLDTDIRSSAISASASVPPGMTGTNIWPDRGNDNWQLVRTTAADPSRSALVGITSTTGSVTDAEFGPFTDVVITGNVTAYVIPARQSVDVDEVVEVPRMAPNHGGSPDRPSHAARRRSHASEALSPTVVVLGIVGGCVALGAAAGKVLIGSVAAAFVGGLGGLAAGTAIVLRGDSGARRRPTSRACNSTSPPNRTDAPSRHEPSAPSKWTTSKDDARSKVWK